MLNVLRHEGVPSTHNLKYGSRHCAPPTPARKLPDVNRAEAVHIHIDHELRNAQGIDRKEVGR